MTLSITRRGCTRASSGTPASTCLEQSTLTFDYDFEGFRANQLRFDWVHTPDCEGNPGSYCKGQIASDFGEASLEP